MKIQYAVLVLAFSQANAIAAPTVEPDGSATVTIGVDVPPGRTGTEPKLALRYNSGGSQSTLLTDRWVLTGVPAIERCTSSLQVDAEYGGRVTYTDSDKLCIGGARLYQVGADGKPLVGAQSKDAAPVADGAFREYRIEGIPGARVRAYGGEGLGAKRGPQRFRAWFPTGTVEDYGSSATSGKQATFTVNGATVAWGISRRQVVGGGWTDYKYSTGQSSASLQMVDGSGTIQTSPSWWRLEEIKYGQNRVKFEYENRPANEVAESRRFDLGIFIESPQRLSSIKTYINIAESAQSTQDSPTKHLVSNYLLTYGAAGLEKVQRCTGTQGRCDIATSFAYFTRDVGNKYVNTPFVVTSNSTNLPGQEPSQTIVADVNNDGLSDMLLVGERYVRVYRNIGAGKFQEQASVVGYPAGNELATAWCGFIPEVSDLNGDGWNDIVFKPDLVKSFGQGGLDCKTNRAGKAYLNNKQGGFTEIGLPAVWTAEKEKPWSPGAPLVPGEMAKIIMLDFDGDQSMDMLVAKLQYTGTNPVYDNTTCKAANDCTQIYKGDGSGGWVAAQSNIGGTQLNPGFLEVGDFNRDGYADILMTTRTSPLVVAGPYQFKVLYGRGDGNFTSVDGPVCEGSDQCELSPFFPMGQRHAAFLLGVKNKPEKNALWVQYEKSTSLKKVSTFNLTSASDFIATGNCSQSDANNATVHFVDVNSDGLADIVSMHQVFTQSFAAISNGDGSFTKIASNITAFPAGVAPFVVGCAGRTVVKAEVSGSGTAEIVVNPMIGGYFIGTPVPESSGALKTIREGRKAWEVQFANKGLELASSSTNAVVQRDETINAGRLQKSTHGWVVSKITETIGAKSREKKMRYIGEAYDKASHVSLGFARVLEEYLTSAGSVTTVKEYSRNSRTPGKITRSARYEFSMADYSSAAPVSDIVHAYCSTNNSSNEVSTALLQVADCPQAGSPLEGAIFLAASKTQGTDSAGFSLPKTLVKNTVDAYLRPLNQSVTIVGAEMGDTHESKIVNSYEPLDFACSDIENCTIRLTGPSSSSEQSVAGNYYPSSGTTLIGGVVASPTSLTFPPTSINTTSGSMTITLSNPGALPRIVAATVDSPRFTVSSSTCSTLYPTQTCTIAVQFTPVSTGATSGTLSLYQGGPVVTLSGSALSSTTPYSISETQSVSARYVDVTWTMTALQTSQMTSVGVVDGLENAQLLSNSCVVGSTYSQGSTCSSVYRFIRTCEDYSASMVASTASGSTTATTTIPAKLTGCF